MTTPADVTKTTVIKAASWVVAYDEATDRHVYRTDCDVAFRGDRFVLADAAIAASADEVIDGRNLMVMPGFVDIHSHPSFETMLKGLTEEVGSAKLYMSSLYEYLFLFETEAAGMVASSQVALSELLQSGVTTVCDLSVPHEGWLDTLAASGLRAYAAPMFRAARWYTRNGHEVLYEWDIPLGRKRMDEALAVVDAAVAHPSGRLSGMICPAQIDTCDEALFRDAFAAAQDRGLPFQTHASQSVVEFQEMMRRHGRTPVGWLKEIGVLGPLTTIGHGIFFDHNDWLGWPTRDDVRILVESGASVAHCPTVFIRRGITLQHLGGYLKAGLNVGIGTDTFPHNYVEEVRNAIYAARITARDAHAVNASDALHAATLGGAKALGRTDIGRVAPGAKADFFTVDLTHPAMRPLYDPVRSLFYTAGERPIRDVYVDGRKVVESGRALAFDLDDALNRLEEAQRLSVSKVGQYDWANRPASELMPLTL
ncbi:amidohydrolase family protein [Microvirga antarctica]|uniref:amidohydrolase family protein n=1 Tax=Microvirga antarctica TaxID=2819233 RepID=UPI001B316108|nr:amidohydrolase family protein [Microvirga antarctica]